MVMNDLFPEQLADALPALDRASGLSRLEAFVGKAGGLMPRAGIMIWVLAIIILYLACLDICDAG